MDLPNLQAKTFSSELHAADGRKTCGAPLKTYCVDMLVSKLSAHLVKLLWCQQFVNLVNPLWLLPFLCNKLHGNPRFLSTNEGPPSKCIFGILQWSKELNIPVSLDCQSDKPCARLHLVGG